MTDGWGVPEDARCAEVDCDRPVTIAVRYETIVLAYACQPTHLRAVMWATKHLGMGRVVDSVTRTL
jgi:hypothetical protein